MAGVVELKKGAGIELEQIGTDLFVSADSFVLKIVASGAGAGEENWTGSGPYVTAAVDTGFTGDSTNTIIQFFDQDKLPTDPIYQDGDFDDMSAALFRSNTNADLYVLIYKAK